MIDEKYYFLNEKNEYWELNGKSLYYFLKRNLHAIGHNWNDTYVVPIDYVTVKRFNVDFIVFDKDWRVVHREKLIELIDKLSNYYDNISYSPFFYRNLKRNYLGFRKGPVPYTGKSFCGYGQILRNPKTKHERKWSCAHGKFARAKRNKTSLPSNWDDIPRSDSLDKYSWKKNKKRKQWMK